MRDRTFGPIFSEEIDGPRIRKQHEVIRDHMLACGAWRSLSEIAAHTGFPEASISAQLRHLRKARFGSFGVSKRRRQTGGGTWEYRVIPQFRLEGGKL